MHDSTIGRNYAQALFALAKKANQVDAYGGLIGALANAIGENPVLRRFLESPQVAEGAKRAVFRAALAEKAPRSFVLFLEKLISNRRQMLVPQIAAAYSDLVDEHEGRVHATITVARPPQPGDAEELSKRLSAALNKAVVGHIVVNPAIIGGLVVRIGDSVMDGSVQRRLNALRQALAGTAR